jgi:hypothetical protein
MNKSVKAEPWLNLWGMSGLGEYQGANRKRGGCHSLASREGIAKEGENKGISHYKGLWGTGVGKQTYGKGVGVIGHGRKYMARNGRNNMRSVRGNKERARARQCPEEDKLA